MITNYDLFRSILAKSFYEYITQNINRKEDFIPELEDTLIAVDPFGAEMARHWVGEDEVDDEIDL